MRRARQRQICFQRRLFPRSGLLRMQPRKRPDEKEGDGEIDFDDGYSLNGSIWDASILLGTSVAAPARSTFSSLLLMLPLGMCWFRASSLGLADANNLLTADDQLQGRREPCPL